MNAIHRIFRNGVAIERLDTNRASFNEAQEIKDNLLDDVDCKKIIIDLSSCNYMDSTFLGAMIFAYRALRHQDCEFALVIGESFFSKSYIYNEITNIFKVYSSMNEAMNAFNESLKFSINQSGRLERKDNPATIVQMHLQLRPE